MKYVAKCVLFCKRGGGGGVQLSSKVYFNGVIYLIAIIVCKVQNAGLYCPKLYSIVLNCVVPTYKAMASGQEALICHYYRAGSVQSACVLSSSLKQLSISHCMSINPVYRTNENYFRVNH